MNLDLSQKDVTLIMETLMSRIDGYQAEGVNDQVDSAREELEELVGKMRTAQTARLQQ